MLIRNSARTLLAIVPMLASMAWAEVTSTPLAKPLASKAKTRFTQVAHSGIDFHNRWTPPAKYEHELVNAVSKGGVCMGDADGDGLPEVFLTQPFAGNRLYKNLGGFRFRDITQEAGLSQEHLWGMGCSFADVDNDGDLDLYVCGYDCPNRLYINDGKGRFTEKAKAFGVDYRGASVMAAFADYDRDGDLDLYLCNNHIDPPEAPLWKYETRKADGMPILPDDLKGVAKVLYRPDIKQGKLVPAGEQDRLYRNNGDGTFTDVTKQSGIVDEDFGLSATWWDYDHDGDADLYNANDFYDPDHLWRNNGDGTFTDVNKVALPHTPWFSMGADVADINNDGLLDFMASDMQSTTHYKQKLSMGDMQGWFLETAFPRQYMRNALYLNTGTPRFMEVAFMAGVESTDWTWSLKFGDLDNDGWVDLYVTNGSERFWDNSDIMKEARGNQRINTPELKQVWMPTPPRKDPNLAYKNEGELRFRDVSKEWGLHFENVSYGAALGDLDNDGDLDLVVNNFDSPATIYRNESLGQNAALIQLRGGKSNRHGLDALLRVKTKVGQQTRYHTLSSGYMSANDPRVHFGLGKEINFELEVDWPSGVRQRLSNLKANHWHVITEEGEPAPKAAEARPMFLLSDALKQAGRAEKPFDDYAEQPLLPNKLSQLGPGQAWGDVNGDGADDLFLGRPAHVGDRGIMLATQTGFTPSPQAAMQAHATCEDMGALFLDVDGDGDLDLFVVSGGVESKQGEAAQADRLYLNDGKGAFVSAPSDALPDLRESGGAAAAADFDRDGDLDIFVGGRVVPGAYPTSSPSRLLRNEKGKFTDTTDSLAPGLTKAGMVTSALWSDANGDGWLDLLVTREWGSIGLWLNASGKLEEAKTDVDAFLGWWNSIAAGDIDHDGDMDYAVGNFGLNTKYNATAKKPARLYYGDFDGSGKSQIIEAKLAEEGLLPVRGKSCSQRAMPMLKEKFPTFQSFATATLRDIYSEATIDKAAKFEANELQSGLLINDGKGHFAFQPLPRVAQASPVFGLGLSDVDGDGNLDLLLAQNFYAPQPETGNMDGGVGLLLLGNGLGQFEPIWPDRSGILIPADAKSLATVDLNQDAWPDFVVATNSGPVFTFLHLGESKNQPLSFRLQGKPGNPTAIGARVTLHVADLPPQTVEIHAGGGYLTQTPATASFAIPAGKTAETVEITWPNGERIRVELKGSKSRRLLIRQG